MNPEKTKLVWIGASEGSNIKWCEDLKFEWGNTEFNALGVNFTVNVEDIWSRNTDKKNVRDTAPSYEMETPRSYYNWQSDGYKITSSF